MSYNFLKNLKPIKVLLIYLLLFALFLPACNNKPDNILVGKWQAPDNSGKFTFYQDGTVVMDGSSGTYRILEKGLLEFNISGLSGWKGLVRSFTVSDEEFILKWPELNKVDRYKRVDSFRH